MPNVTIYHNPRCSKSRQTLALLQEQGIEPTIIEYLKTPLTKAQLEDLLNKLNVPAENLVRKKEAAYKELGLQGQSNKALINAIAKHPVLMERPIVVNGNKAAIGRPPENVLEII